MTERIDNTHKTNFVEKVGAGMVIGAIIMAAPEVAVLGGLGMIFGHAFGH